MSRTLIKLGWCLPPACRSATVRVLAVCDRRRSSNGRVEHVRKNQLRAVEPAEAPPHALECSVAPRSRLRVPSMVRVGLVGALGHRVVARDVRPQLSPTVSDYALRLHPSTDRYAVGCTVLVPVYSTAVSCMAVYCKPYGYTTYSTGIGIPYTVHWESDNTDSHTAIRYIYVVYGIYTVHRYRY